MKLNIQTAVSNKIVRKPAASKEAQRIFDKYITSTLAKIDRSISDANGRYNTDGVKSYENPKPSLNWKVVGKADSDNPENENVMVFLKVGIEKVVIDQETGATELKVPSSVLISVLEEMRSNIESLATDRESEEAKDFWKLAIKQAMPKTTPKDGGTWEYDGASDTYIVKQ